jgi:hypothetical protein
MRHLDPRLVAFTNPDTLPCRGIRIPSGLNQMSRSMLAHDRKVCANWRHDEEHPG